MRKAFITILILTFVGWPGSSQNQAVPDDEFLVGRYFYMWCSRIDVRNDYPFGMSFLLPLDSIVRINDANISTLTESIMDFTMYHPGELNANKRLMRIWSGGKQCYYETLKANPLIGEDIIAAYDQIISKYADKPIMIEDLEDGSRFAFYGFEMCGVLQKISTKDNGSWGTSLEPSIFEYPELKWVYFPLCIFYDNPVDKLPLEFGSRP